MYSIYMLLNATDLMPENAKCFECIKCDFKCSKKSNFTKHIMTPKHTNATKCYENATQMEEKNAVCPFCKKNFKHSSSMYRHKKTCKNTVEQSLQNNDNQLIDTEDLIKYLMKENTEFKQMLIDQNKQMIEIAKNAGNNNTTNTEYIQKCSS
jgi:hypothetical protein